MSSSSVTGGARPVSVTECNVGAFPCIQCERQVEDHGRDLHADICLSTSVARSARCRKNVTCLRISTRHQLGPPASSLRGLHESATGNAQAFGFSITITVTFGVCSADQPSASTPELMIFAVSGVAAFSLLNLLVAHLVKTRSDRATSNRVVLIATATDFLAVAAAVGCAIGVRYLAAGLTRWSLAPLAAGLAYVLVQSIELAIGQQETKASQDGNG